MSETVGMPDRTTLLIVVTTLLPLAWGCGVYLFVAKVWPKGRPVPDVGDSGTNGLAPPLTFRI